MTSRRAILKTGIGLAAAALMPAKPALSSQRINREMRAGAGCGQVVLTDLFPLGDFTGEHDPLFVRILLLDDGQHKLATGVVDLTSLAETLITRMKTIIFEMTGIPASQTMIVASHSFSTPHITDISRGARSTPLDIKLMAAFENALRVATRDALATFQPAKIGAGSAYSRVGVNRDVITPYGWWLGADDSGFSDPHVGVLRIDGRSGKPLAVMINSAVQPAVMEGSQCESGGRLISADIAGAAVAYVEKYYDRQTVAFYLTGAAGDQIPFLQANRHIVRSDGRSDRIDMHEAGFAIVKGIGERLGAQVTEVSEHIETGNLASLNLFRKSVTVPAIVFSPRNAPTGPVRSFSYKPCGEAEMPVILMQWGDIALVGVQPELSAATGAYIRAASPYPHTWVITMADGAAKYMPDKKSYDHFTYEARSSPFAKGAAESAADFIIYQLKIMKSQQS